jgi:hypothetical protein
MSEACSLVWSVLVLLFRSRVSLEAEILILRHQLNIQRTRPASTPGRRDGVGTENPIRVYRLIESAKLAR